MAELREIINPKTIYEDKWYKDVGQYYIVTDTEERPEGNKLHEFFKSVISHIPRSSH